MVVDRSLKGRIIRRRAAVTAALALAAGACSDGAAKPAARPPASSLTTTTTVTAASTSTSIASEEAAVRAAYEAASRAFIDAAAIPDPDSAAVAGTHVGPMLDQRRMTLRGLRAEGKAIRYPTPSQYRIEIEHVTIEGDVARLTVCVVDDGERVEASNGATTSSSVGTVRWKAAMRRVDGTWLLAERIEDSRWDGVAGCATD